MSVHVNMLTSEVLFHQSKWALYYRMPSISLHFYLR